MKRAQTLIVRARFFQLDMLPNYINDVHPIQEIDNKGLWDERHMLSM